MMIDSGEIEHYDVNAGKYSGTWCISDNHNSAEHDICISIISKHLKNLNLHNRIYNSSYGPDIVLYCNNEQYAIEYETGTKDIEETAKMIGKRATKYTKTIIVVNDLAYQKYSERFQNVIKMSDIEAKLPIILNL